MALAHNHHDLTSLWWPEERIKATLNTKYIVNQLQPNNVPRLFDLPKWGEGLTSETYMEYILVKAGRLFLILNEIGIPDRIFALVDESCDDDDLPVAEQNVDQLRLSPNGDDPALDSKFFHTQWRYSVRGIGEGEHVTYTGNEGVPVQVLRTGIAHDLQDRDDTVDKVVLAGSVCRVLMRTQVQVGGAPYFFSSEEVLAEIKALRKLAHPHVMSIYASYFVDDSVCVLFTGAEADRTLNSFLTDEPPAFKRLPKEQRRQTLITWPHCLISALSWLHSHGHFHGSIRPSNILIDADLNIFLGQFHVLDSLLTPPRVNDLESYQYSAPERWVRTAAPVQPIVSQSRTLLPSGGRTARRKKPPRLTLSPLDESPPNNPRPDSAASKGTVIRIGRTGSPSRFSFAFSTSSSSSSSAASSANATELASPSISSGSTGTRYSRSSLWKRPKALIPTPSITSSKSSSSSGASIRSNPLTPHSVSSNPTLLTNWQSTQTNPASSDLFSLAAIILDIITHLCKRSLSSFASHRSARNRSAGRGGGMADASFHLARNSVQVQSWIALLEGDALKRCRRDRGSDQAFYAVPRMLIVVRAMLAAEPEKRPSAKRVRKCFGAAIKEIPVGKSGGEPILVHCVDEKKEKEKPVVQTNIKIRVQREESQKEVDVRGKSGRVRFGRSREVLPAPTDSSSVSDFDFGFSDGGSDSETLGDEMYRNAPSLLEEEDEDDVESVVQVDRVSPQLSLPELDIHLTGIEGLKLHQ
ncbi:uncharacterized protein N7483_000472 [Penicillium malachiteum]|uniref:uncharacterized protein n=1 Tax=Penicillium malachiteum TaxID=1324776 RepID=UPI0025498D59|nr:uncharacterized protein N7483_000472 [Penicillium malachiteum]KAJ5735347.1 hypothetical protein N7483_000472 [Penicillium malachiteum]